ncbi:hypothetical protein SAMN05216436_114105 [bacterium A37T11]|nr:hypothetical protein SAMN05216436_114105 [bacterium A37T11]
MLYDKGKFYAWVPEKLRVVLLWVMILPLLVAGGMFAANATDMYSGLGRYAEDFAFANYCATIGMVVAFSVIFPIKARFRSKEIVVFTFLTIALMSYLTAQVEDPYLIALFNFVVGFVKIMGMIEVVLPVMVMISPTGDRGKFYAYFYPISIGSGQVSAFLMAFMNYHINWQYVNYVATCVMLACALLAVVFMHNKRPGKLTPLQGIDWISMVMLTVWMLLINYLVVNAKFEGWGISTSLKIAFGCWIITTALFIYRQLHMKNPFLPLAVFKKRNVLTAFLLIGCMGMFSATSTLQTGFSNLLKYDSPTNASLNAAMLPGVVTGGFLALFLFKQNASIRWMFAISFSAFTSYAIMMYFNVAPVIQYEYLLFPAFLKGLGMALTYIGGGFYFANKLNPSELMKTIPLLIGVRSFISTAFFTAVFQYGLFESQWDSIYSLVGRMDASDYAGIDRGGGLSLYASVQTQATLMAIKKVFGYLSLAGLLIIVYTLLHPYQRMHHRNVILWRKRFRRQPVDGYRKYGHSSNGNAEAASAAAAG